MMPTWPFEELQPRSYDLVMVDPPWTFKTYSDKTLSKSPQRHYRCMKLAKIMALPVAALVRPPAALFLWATWPMLRQALEVMTAWGFTYKTGGSWQKRTRRGRPGFGTGYIVRSSTEPFLLGTVGRPKYASRSERNAFETIEGGLDAGLRQHSRKPDEQYAMLERLFPQARRCELFSRADRPGWESWGDQAGVFGSGA